MRAGLRLAITSLLVSGLLLSAVRPASAIEIFGIRLWGGAAEDDDLVEIIDPLPYTVTFETGDAPEALASSLRAASGLWAERTRPAPGRAGLIARARGDYRRILAALYNAGYYGPEISIRLAGIEAADIPLDADLPDEVPVVVEVSAGPQFLFGRTEIVNPPPPVRRPDEVDFPDVGFARGLEARARAVGDAARLAEDRWRARSRAKAREIDREVIADHALSELDVRIVIDPGPRVTYGRTIVRETGRVDPDFIRYMANLPEGQPFNPREVERAQARLARLDVFRSLRIQEAEDLNPDDSMDMIVVTEDRLPRRFGVGATLSTIDGFGIEGFWLHRNLFGRAERLRVDGSVQGIGRSTDPNDFDYQLGIGFTRPGTITPDTDFVASLVGLRAKFETYRETSVTARAGFTQDFGRLVRGQAVLQVQASRIEDDLGTREFLTVGPLLNVQYDRRNDALEPTRGYYLAAELYPFYEQQFDNFAVRGAIEGRYYQPLDADERFVAAARARLGAFGFAPSAESPPGQLFFAGGGGSVRGYGFRSIGVEQADGATVGGRSLVELSGELRARFTNTIGGVAFLDAGVVGDSATSIGNGSWQYGAGVGLRYQTGIGAIRVDVAAPLNPRDGDPTAALYIGIGQAF